MGQRHRVIPEQFFGTFSRLHPVLARIEPGDTIETTCLDSAGCDRHGDRRTEIGNPLTGPFFVDGAEPGDSLSVHLTRVRLNRDWGYSLQRLGLYSLIPESVEGIYAADYKPGLVLPGQAGLLPWDIDLDEGTVRLREPRSRNHELTFPVKPMIGCIGVAPAGDFAPTTSPSGAYGGNLDYNQIAEGATVHLPVYHPGALLFLGDGHALQGDGEPLGCGIETSMDVEFTVVLRKDRSLNGPRVETPESLTSIGSQAEFASSMNRGLQLATSDMVNWLVAEHGMEVWAAHLLIGLTCRYDVVTVNGSVAVTVPKSYLPSRVPPIGDQ